MAYGRTWLSRPPAVTVDQWGQSQRGIPHEQAAQNTAALETLVGGGSTGTVAVGYETAYRSKSAVVGAVAGKVADPARALDELFAWWPWVGGVQPVPPGPLGGEVRCGKGVEKLPEGGYEGKYVDLCAWADRHTIGMVVFRGFGERNKPEDMFLRVRSQVERPAS
ncbi:hypothetical protein GA0070558_11894 [Micromonospora haikouensis]|uniref:Uncharacterized protein n=1 Tax=Micromonospora haikouensis TaxID=686309 RepID=A0A1C4WUA8_9ACTN|nr:hypothetical protein [Micromonospora haikouensis]SCE99769.1 hypothetical protein GA0070558_11894 [Micromonospora haikouensis]